MSHDRDQNLLHIKDATGKKSDPGIYPENIYHGQLGKVLDLPLRLTTIEFASAGSKVDLDDVVGLGIGVVVHRPTAETLLSGSSPRL